MLAHVEAGRGDALVLVHGSPVSSRSFRAQIARLASSFRVLAPDLLGFGQSPRPTEGAGFVEQARAFSDWSTRLGLDRHHLVVHDWGGPIALAATEPAALDRLVLVNTTLDPEFRPPWYWSPWVGPALGDLLVDRLNLLSLGLAALLPPAADRAAVRRDLADPSTRRAVLRLERLDGFREVAARAVERHGERRRPTAIVWGHPDPYFRRADLRRLTARFPAATRIELPGAGHFPQEAAPERFGDALLEVLAPPARGAHSLDE